MIDDLVRLRFGTACVDEKECGKRNGEDPPPSRFDFDGGYPSEPEGECAERGGDDQEPFEPERAAPPQHEHKVGKHGSAEGELQRCFTVAPKEAASQPGSNENNYSAEKRGCEQALIVRFLLHDEAERFARNASTGDDADGRLRLIETRGPAGDNLR